MQKIVVFEMHPQSLSIKSSDVVALIFQPSWAESEALKVQTPGSIVRTPKSKDKHCIVKRFF